MRALHGWDHHPCASHAVNALKDQTVVGVPSLTPWIITIPGRRPVPPRPRGFREPPACGCSPAMQSGRRPPQTTGDNREPEGRYQGSNGNSAPRAALPPLAAGASALPHGTLAVRPPIWRCSRDTEPTPAGRLGAAAFPPGWGPPLGQKCDLPLRASVVELLHPPWRGSVPPGLLSLAAKGHPSQCCRLSVSSLGLVHRFVSSFAGFGTSELTAPV